MIKLTDLINSFIPYSYGREERERERERERDMQYEPFQISKCEYIVVITYSNIEHIYIIWWALTRFENFSQSFHFKVAKIYTTFTLAALFIH